MKLNTYQWAALAAALLTPTLLYAAITSRGKKKTGANTAMQNLQAFLQMIQYAEGTIGPNAYRTLYGGGVFNDYSRHPNKAITKWGITSTGAGAYGFLYRTWIELQAALRLSDFSPASQNKAAIELIRKRAALEDVLAGRIPQAIYKCRKIWASFPGAGYGQSEKPLGNLLKFYMQAGGQIATT